jgi:uncharacterized protein YecT (DUF1311 family)
MSEDLAEAQKEGNHSQIKYDQTGIANLKKAQRGWLSYRRIQCDAAAQRYEGGSMMPMIYSECLKTLTEEQRSASQTSRSMTFTTLIPTMLIEWC